MKKFLLKLSCAILFVLTTTTVSAASILINSDGKLAGIKGINVSGFGLYDVTFNDVFDYSLGGNSYGFVTAAANALYAAFNGDGLLADTVYDQSPELVEGCEGTVSCELTTAYVHTSGFDTGSYYFFRNTERFEFEQEGVGYGQGNLYPQASRTFAVWSESSLIATPIPSAALLFAPALLGAINLRRKCKLTTSDEQNISM
ncbi:hypothetical protein GCM10007891_29260 [Methylophaga thalassica]|uniref:Secreted protein n=2 Tax=Methylophaga thalassica TaxID=40223 RepID=A0ABQ5TXZ3_9GAMM|nr:hypothetical protein [Methylophaga thalassica]GLQ01073.1 hypothetical protein GCM10007891_29260 [Methylophaga thalassica]